MHDSGRRLGDTSRVLLLIAILLLCYLIGSLSGALLLGRLRGVDIRTRGSGNAGGTNALRTLGWRFALAVVAIDLGKGALAAGLALAIHDPQAPLSDHQQALCGVAAAAIGHRWPLYFGFRGGKGAATLGGGLLLLWPAVVPLLLVVWLLVLTSSGYVGLASMLAALATIPSAIWFGGEQSVARLAFAVFAAAFVLYTHRDNLRRLLRGEENRFERARLLHRWLRGTDRP